MILSPVKLDVLRSGLVAVYIGSKPTNYFKVQEKADIGLNQTTIIVGGIEFDVYSLTQITTEGVSPISYTPPDKIDYGGTVTAIQTIYEELVGRMVACCSGDDAPSSPYQEVSALPGTGAEGIFYILPDGSMHIWTGASFLQVGGSSAQGGLVYVNESIPAGNTIENTVTETAFASEYTIAGDSLSEPTVFRVRLSGIYSTDAVLAPTIRVRVKMGVTTILDTGIITAVIGAADSGWTADMVMVVTTPGATASVEAQGFIEFATGATIALVINTPNSSPYTIDTTVDVPITATVEWGTADVDNTVQLRVMEVYQYDTITATPTGDFVESVTGSSVDNTDPLNPVVNADPAGSAATAQAAAEAYADSLVTGLWDDRGNYDASSNVFPSTGGSGTAGAILKGDIWTISVPGTLLDQDENPSPVIKGDTVRALIDSAGAMGADWAIGETNLGYVPENVANKATGLGVPDNTTYPTTLAVVEELDAAVFKRVAVRVATTTALPAYTVSGGGLVLTANAVGALPAQDGITLSNNELILVKDEAGGNIPNNGKYQVTSVGSGGSPWVFTRTNDTGVVSRLNSAVVRVGPEGTTNKNKIYKQTTFVTSLGVTNVVWDDISGGGVNPGTQYRIAYYATTGSTLSEAAAITAAKALKSDPNGVPTHFDTTTEPSMAELVHVKGVTSAIQTQIDGKANVSTQFSIFGNTAASLSTRYFQPGGGTGSTTESAVEMQIELPMTVIGLGLRTSSTQSALGSLTFFIRNTNSDTAVTIVVAGGAVAGYFADIAHSAAFVSPNKMTISMVNAAAATSANLFNGTLYTR